jgi:hypothetical protein
VVTPLIKTFQTAMFEAPYHFLISVTCQSTLVNQSGSFVLVQLACGRPIGCEGVWLTCPVFTFPEVSLTGGARLGHTGMGLITRTPPWSACKSSVRRYRHDACDHEHLLSTSIGHEQGGHDGSKPGLQEGVPWRVTLQLSACGSDAPRSSAGESSRKTGLKSREKVALLAWPGVASDECFRVGTILVKVVLV